MQCAAVPAIPGGLGNRAIGRWALTLNRKEATTSRSVPVLLVGPPPPVEAVKRATPENRRLAEEIDALDNLSDDRLVTARDVAAAGAVGPASDEQRRQLQKLEAIELQVRRRSAAGARFAPLAPNYGFHSRGNATPRRLDVRAQIEKGVRETGSFGKALKLYTRTKEVEGDYAFFEQEAARFEKEFERQAGMNAKRMLQGSWDGIKQVLASYGLPGWSAGWAAGRLNAGDDIDKLAASVIRDAKISANVDDLAYDTKRRKLAEWVKGLKKRQKTVEDALLASNRADNKRPFGARTSADDAADTANAKLAAARAKLNEAWIKAERAHPIFASYRRGGELEKVDLGNLHTDPVDQQMHSVLVQVLPKMAGIVKALELIDKGDLDPLSLPSVVALTRANMFIPTGSIRAGVVKDMVDEATDDDSIFLQVAAFALAIVTLLPSGGASLAIPAGMAAAGVAVYAVDKEWDKYSKQKILVNTDLDLARSLSSEEPSLTGFALSLVNLGFEAIPLVGAFNKARRLKTLVLAGDESGEIGRTVKWLNDKGTPRGAPDLGNRALADIEAAEQRAAKAADPAPHPGEPRATHHAPARVPASNKSKKKLGGDKHQDATDPDAEVKSGRESKPPRDDARKGPKSKTPKTPGPVRDIAAQQRDRLRAGRFDKLADELDELPVGPHKDRFVRQLSGLSNRELGGLEQIARLESDEVNLSAALDDMMRWQDRDRRELLGLIADVGPRSGRDGLEDTLHSIFQRTIKETGTEVHALKGSWGELYAARDAVTRFRATHIEFQIPLSDTPPKRIADIVADTPNGRLFFEVKTNTLTPGGIIDNEVIFDLVHFAGSKYENLRYLYHPNVTAHQRRLLGERMIAFFDDPLVAGQLGGSVDRARAAFRAWLDKGGLGAYSI